MVSFSKFSHFFFSILVLFLLACGSQDAPGAAKGLENPASHASETDGAAIFGKNCKICHGADGKLGLNGAKDLSISVLSLSERINIITHGKNLMTPFGGLLTPAEIEAVASYTLKLKQDSTK